MKISLNDIKRSRYDDNFWIGFFITLLRLPSWRPTYKSCTSPINTNSQLCHFSYGMGQVERTDGKSQSKEI